MVPIFYSSHIDWNFVPAQNYQLKKKAKTQKKKKDNRKIGTKQV